MRRALLPAVGLIALLTPITAVSPIIWLVVLADAMPGSTRARQFMFALVTALAINSATLTVLSVFGKGCSPRTLMAALLTLALLVRAARPREPSRPWISRDGILSLAFGAFTYAVLAVPLIGASVGKMASALSFSTDGATHVELVTAISRSHGYVQLLHPPGLSDAIDRYPSGWHGSVWLTTELFLGHTPDTGQLISAVGFIAMGTYAFFAALCCRVGLSLLSRATGARPGWTELAFLVALTATLITGAGIFLLQMASYTQIAGLAAVLCLILLGTGPGGANARRMAVLGACCIALMQCWYLLALVVAAPASLLLGRWRPRPGALALLVVTTAPICLYPIVTGPSSTRLAAQGPTYLPTLMGIVGLLVTAGVSCRYVAVRRDDGMSPLLLATTSMGLITMVALVLRQGFITSSGVSYYASKVLLATLLLGVVGTAAILSTGLQRRPDALAALLALAGIAAAGWSTRRDAIPPQLNPSAREVNARTLDAILRDHPLGAPPGTRTWVLDGCNRVWDRIATKWLYDTTLTWTPSFATDLVRYSEAKRGDVSMFADELADPGITRIELYLHRECDRVAVATLSKNPKVRVIRVP